MVLVVGEVRAGEMDLSDGWYTLPCSLDPQDQLGKLVQKGLFDILHIMYNNSMQPYYAHYAMQTINYLNNHLMKSEISFVGANSCCKLKALQSASRTRSPDGTGLHPDGCCVRLKIR